MNLRVANGANPVVCVVRPMVQNTTIWHGPMRTVSACGGKFNLVINIEILTVSKELRAKYVDRCKASFLNTEKRCLSEVRAGLRC